MCQTNIKIYSRKVQKGLKQESRFLAIRTFLASSFCKPTKKQIEHPNQGSKSNPNQDLKSQKFVESHTM